MRCTRSSLGELHIAARVIFVGDLGGNESPHHVGVGHRGCPRAAGSWIPLADAVERGGNAIVSGSGRSADLDGSPNEREGDHAGTLTHVFTFIQ